jgi:lipopolysaccharide export system protein LptC
MTESSNENFETSLQMRFKQPIDGYVAGVGNAHPRETLHQARRYSAFVRFMKRILPLAALGLAIAILAYAVQPREGGQMPFVVTATSAVQLGPAAERVRLENVNADLVLKDGTELNVIAAQGVIDNQTQTLDFYGGIQLSTADGYTAETDSARADLRQGVLHGESPVAVQGAMGSLTAQGFTFERSSGMLHFTGDVRMEVSRSTQ